jgi:hypothetical protein
MPSRIDLPLIRRRDRKNVGTLTIVRASHPAFTDETGARRANPVRLDQLLITLTEATGEEVTALQVPMNRLPAWIQFRHVRRDAHPRGARARAVAIPAVPTPGRDPDRLGQSGWCPEEILPYRSSVATRSRRIAFNSSTRAAPMRCAHSASTPRTAARIAVLAAQPRSVRRTTFARWSVGSGARST